MPNPEKRWSISTCWVLVWHYFIDLRDTAGIIHDEEGAEFASLEEALNEAKDSARDLVKQFLDNRIPLSECCVEARDTEGRVVAVLTVAEVLVTQSIPLSKTTVQTDLCLAIARVDGTHVAVEG